MSIMRYITNDTQVSTRWLNMVHTLLVEERAGVAHALQTVLEGAGYRTTIAHDIDSAHNAVATQAINLLILADDVVDGRIKRLPARLKTNPSTQHVPVVVYSDEFRLANADYVRWLGADAVWSTPHKADDLLTIIDGLVPRQSA